MSVYDQLGIDDAEGLDADKIQAIKNGLARIRVAAAGVTKENDADDSLILISAIEKKIRKVVKAGVSSVDELHHQFATDSSGQPAAALGAGAAPTPNDLQEALNVILAAPGATVGQKAAMTRIFFGGADRIEVEDDGTPKELISTRTQRDTEKRAKDTAERSLAEERDPNKANSLAAQLAAAQAAPATPADMVRKSDIEPKVQEALTALGAVKGPGRMKAVGTDAVKTKIEEIKVLVS
jgi:hypothetical protein